MYSGHMAGYVTGFCTLVYYVEKIFGKDEKIAKYHCRPSMITTLVITFYVLGMIGQVILAVGMISNTTAPCLKDE